MSVQSVTAMCSAVRHVKYCHSDNHIMMSEYILQNSGKPHSVPAYTFSQSVIHIVTFGENEGGILAGIRNFPTNKLAILYYEDEKSKTEEFARSARSTVGISILFMPVSRNNLIPDVIERVAEILENEPRNFTQILMNVSAGDKMLSIAASVAAFVNGITAFSTDDYGSPKLLPIIKLSYNETISDAKTDILLALDEAGGSVQNLEELSKISGYGKPLLSYHMQSGDGSKGLADLGLVEVERGQRGRLGVKLTTLGKLVVTNSTIKLKV